MATEDLKGFDPLLSHGDETISGGSAIFEDATKRVVHNILRSYTGFYDLFSEAIQNSLDAVEIASRERGERYSPKIWITIDIPGSSFRIVDNGVGMDLDQFKYCFRPNVSFKKQANVRGEKGVGATFLAYGFSFISLQSKKNGSELAAILRQGRQWAEDERGVIPRPTFESQGFAVPELVNEPSGTCLEIICGKAPGERPRDFTWIGAYSAKQWLDVLRIKTPLGGVYLSGIAFAPQIEIKVIASKAEPTVVQTNRAEYYYPHEIPDMKVQQLEDIIRSQNLVKGDASTKFKSLPQEFKRLDCIWEIWDKDALLADDSDFGSAIDEKGRELIEKHNVAIYGAFLSTAKTWNRLNDEVLGLRKALRIMHGGMQLASDNMAQGEVSVIPLTSAIGYQNNSHIIVHFQDGSPDMGRKVFQPELTDLAEELAKRVVTIFRRFISHLRADSGAQSITPDKALYDWKREQERFRDEHPLVRRSTDTAISLLSTPQQEQDVIALFHELVGAQTLRGFRFFATSPIDRYDSLFMMDYRKEDSIYWESQSQRLGISRDFPEGQTEPKTLEYKFSLDGLVADFGKELKFVQHINFVVCWTAGKAYRERFTLESLLVGDEGSTRQIFGSTHKAFVDGSSQPIFEVLVLEDLMNWMIDPQSEEARQKQAYRG
ncbi:ATP-binding protein [Granulicella paludicola]|uniref:ATP-binding protein n=1 Tax=Granulicella paludicola TaxID=474951 RepID=UPI0021DFDA7C|nr:ATP-binding protein [Granulicella paludicola]